MVDYDGPRISVSQEKTGGNWRAILRGETRKFSVIGETKEDALRNLYHSALTWEKGAGRLFHESKEAVEHCEKTIKIGGKPPPKPAA